jgi:hypothetical protein
MQFRRQGAGWDASQTGTSFAASNREKARISARGSGRAAEMSDSFQA